MKPKKLTPAIYAIYTAVILGGVLLDQLTKWLVAHYMQLYESRPLLPGILELYYITNKGAAWGMLADARWIFMLISTVMILALLPFLYLGLCDGWMQGVAVAMIISGGIGNMIDRLGRGEVVDFLHTCFMDFPTFNVADSLVCVGAALLVLALLIEIVREYQRTKAAKVEASAEESKPTDSGKN